MNRSTRNAIYDLMHTAVWSVVAGVALLIVLAIIKGAWLVLTS